MSREFAGLDRPPLTYHELNLSRRMRNSFLAAEILRPGMERIAGQMETTGDSAFQASWNRDLALESVTTSLLSEKLEVPANLEDDQIEDWMRGRFVVARLALGNHISEYEGSRWVALEHAFAGDVSG